MAIRAPVTAATVAQAQLSTLLDTAPVGVVIVDEQGQILTYSKTCELLFGYTAAEILGCNARMLVPAEQIDKHEACLAALRHQAGGPVCSGLEVLGLHRDGSTIPLELAVGESMTPEGRQFIGVVRDLRRRQEAELRLSQVQSDMLRMARISAIDEMGAALAHELNQPLTALMLYLQAIDRAGGRQGPDAALPPMVADVLEKAMREVERASEIVQRMRQFVGKHHSSRRSVDLGPLVDDAVELTLLGSRRGTHITRKLASDLPPVMGDPVQIQQAVVSLLRNAVEAVKDVREPDVRIATRLEQDVIALSVSDNGAGIRPEAVPDLFKAFPATTEGGTGLGLMIAKTIAQTHGGDLTVDPGGNGRGASFTLTLPLAEAANE